MKRTETRTQSERAETGRRMSALESERKEQLEETKRWISTNALRKLRKAWRH